MLKRKIYDYFLEWKNNKDHKPLVIKGPRQCGKTFSVMDFARKNYANVVYLNFFEHPEYCAIFSGSLDVDSILAGMSAMFGPKVKLEPHKTCIVFDEIQDCPDARTSLKFFCIDGRFDIMATGSLLGVSGYNDKQPKSIPVGYEDIVEMTPLDFEEFLWAMGMSADVLDLVRRSYQEETPVPLAIHNAMRKRLLEYAIIGGMPEVVNVFVKSGLPAEALRVQRRIVDEYRDDLVKYAPNPDKAYIRQCFDSIPVQLAKDNKKFQFSTVRRKGTYAQLGGSIQWLKDAGIVRLCHNLEITELPLDGNAINDCFKVYMADTGLFVSMLEDGTQFDILQGNLGGYKGAIFENLIADIFGKMGRKLYYFRKDSGLEIDFVIRYKGKCVLVEVKARSGNTKSASTLLNHPEKYNVDLCIKLGDYNVGRADKYLTLPLYMAWLMREV